MPMANHLFSAAAAHSCPSSSKRPPDMSAWTRKALAHSRARAAIGIDNRSGSSAEVRALPGDLWFPLSAG